MQNISTEVNEESIMAKYPNLDVFQRRSNKTAIAWWILRFTQDDKRPPVFRPPSPVKGRFATLLHNPFFGHQKVHDV